MADVPNGVKDRVNFWDWLSENQTEVIPFIQMFQRWQESQGKFKPVPGSHIQTPLEWMPGQPVTLDTLMLSEEELSHLNQGMASGVVKERAIAFIKGFLASVSMAGV
jgi:hypothetical protein